MYPRSWIPRIPRIPEKGRRGETLALAHGHSIIDTTSGEAWAPGARGPHEVVSIMLKYLTTQLSFSTPTSSL